VAKQIWYRWEYKVGNPCCDVDRRPHASMNVRMSSLPSASYCKIISTALRLSKKVEQTIPCGASQGSSSKVA